MKGFNEGKETIIGPDGSILSDVDKRDFDNEIKLAKHETIRMTRNLLVQTDWRALRLLEDGTPVPPGVAVERADIYIQFDQIIAKIDGTKTLAQYDACGWSKQLSDLIDEYSEGDNDLTQITP